MRAHEFVLEKKKRKRRPRWAAYGPGPYGGYGYYAGYSGDSGEGGDGGGGESIDEFAVGGGGDDDGDADPYRYPKPESYRRSVDFFGQFEADHFDREDFDDATGVFKGYWGSKQIAHFKFDNPEKTGSDDPGMGWYYEPETDSRSDNASDKPSADDSKQRKQQELSMINAFLKSGQTPKPGSQIYGLMKKHGVVENFADGNSDLDTIIQKFVDSPSGQKYKAHDCKTVTRAFVTWAEQNNIPTEVITFAPPSAEFVQKNPQFKGKSGEGDGHIMPIVNGNAIDFTIRQFGVNRPFNNPLVTPTSSLPAVYGKFGYFTDKPEWFLGGESHWIGPLKSIPSAIFNQDFGDELLENFADGKKPGRKGLAKRSGVNTKASVSSLRKTAKNSSGEKQRMAHWLANMKAGRAKKNK